jgi:hypothetical protein
LWSPHDFLDQGGKALFDLMMGDKPGQYNQYSKGALDAQMGLVDIDRNNNLLRDSMGQGLATLGDLGKEAAIYYAGAKLGEAAATLAGRVLCKAKPLLSGLKNALKPAKPLAAEAAQTGAGEFLGSADEAYAAIRASSRDVADIAANTGFKPDNIQKIKDHLFMNEHLLDRYVSQGIPATVARFDSDIAIAQAWNRLQNGTFTEADIQLLRHETAEAWFMRRHGPGYSAAHDAAQGRYPAPGN